MQVFILYNRGSENERVATDLHERIKREQAPAELVDADSPRGIQFAQNYDIMGRPAVMVISNDGSPVQIWQGADQLPTLDEITYYARQ